MIKLLKWRIGLCDHRWYVYETALCVSDYGGRWTRCYLRCEKCGNMKIKDVD